MKPQSYVNSLCSSLQKEFKHIKTNAITYRAIVNYIWIRTALYFAIWDFFFSNFSLISSSRASHVQRKHRLNKDSVWTGETYWTIFSSSPHENLLLSSVQYSTESLKLFPQILVAQGPATLFKISLL